MFLREWNDLPNFMKCKEVRPYYEGLRRRKFQLILKRLFDLLMAIVMITFFSIPMIIVAIIIKMDSQGPIFFRQERVTIYGEIFKIHKFRTMVNGAEKLGSGVTVKVDPRVTKVGRVLRKYRIDEIPQLIDIILGKMSFVGTRPEIPKYVKKYSKEMYATLLMPAGITSEASIRFKDESELLNGAEDIDKLYEVQILPEKMKWNLKQIKNYSLLGDGLTLLRTVVAILR